MPARADHATWSTNAPQHGNARLHQPMAGNHDGSRYTIEPTADEAGTELQPWFEEHVTNQKVNIMPQEKQTPREHGSDPAEGPEQTEIQQSPPTGQEPKDPLVQDELRRHSDTATEGE